MLKKLHLIFTYTARMSVTEDDSAWKIAIIKTAVEIPADPQGLPRYRSIVLVCCAAVMAK